MSMEAEPWFEGGSPGAEKKCIPKMDETGPKGMKTIPTMEIMRTLRPLQRLTWLSCTVLM